MGENRGIIYMITNKVNGKIYIGKTKKYYGKDLKHIRGIRARFSRHVSDALTNRNNCVALCSAIRKYGRENFKIEQLTQCKIEMTSVLEVAFIEHYNSRDKKIGYNISVGGGGNGCNVSEETRLKISRKKKISEGCELNIHKIFRKKIHVGYRAHRKLEGIYYYKTFANTKYSLEENYNKAKEWINEIKSGKLDDKKYVKKSELPTNITYKRKKGEIAGYRVNIRINGKLHSKDFISNQKSMEEKLEQAINYKQSILPK